MRRFLLIALLLASIIGFAAEPTTSTQFDIGEGRAHGAYFAAGSPGARSSHAVDPALELRSRLTPATLAAVIAILLAAACITVVVTRAARDSSIHRWAIVAQRGPPALEL